MVGGLILFALAWGASAIIKATILRGPTSFPKALGIGIITVIPLVTILPPSQAGTFSGMLSVFLWLGYSARTQREIRSYLTKNSDYESTVKPEKKEPIKTEKPTMSSSHDDEQFYEQVAAEFNDGTIKQGLWLKAETKAGGDKDRARLLYIEWRVEQLIGEAKQDEREQLIKLEVAQKEEQKRKAEEAIKLTSDDVFAEEQIRYRMRKDIQGLDENAVSILNHIESCGYLWAIDRGWWFYENRFAVAKSGSSERTWEKFSNIRQLKKWVKKNLPLMTRSDDE